MDGAEGRMSIHVTYLGDSKLGLWKGFSSKGQLLSGGLRSCSMTKPSNMSNLKEPLGSNAQYDYNAIKTLDTYSFAY